MESMYVLELTLTSATDLKNVNWRYGPLLPYAVVWVNSDQKLTTNVDNREGDTSPTWNQRLVIPLNGPVNDDTTLHIDIVHAVNPNNESDTKPLIGSAKLRLCEIINDDSPGGVVTRKLHLKRPSGRPHGKVYVEVAVRDGRYATGPVSSGYGVREYGYGGSAPAPGSQYGYPYSATPPPYAAAGGKYGSPYSAPYGAAAPPVGGGYSYGSGSQYYEGSGQEEKKSSKFGGMGTGLAVGAVAGLVGGIALVEGYDAVTDHIADEASEKVEEDEYYDDDDGGDY